MPSPVKCPWCRLGSADWIPSNDEHGLYYVVQLESYVILIDTKQIEASAETTVEAQCDIFDRFGQPRTLVFDDNKPRLIVLFSSSFYNSHVHHPTTPLYNPQFIRLSEHAICGDKGEFMRFNLTVFGTRLASTSPLLLKFHCCRTSAKDRKYSS